MTGMEGPAPAAVLPLWSNMARTRPYCWPLRMTVALVQGAVLDQDGGHRPAPLVEAGLDHHAAARPSTDRLEFEHFGLEQGGLEQLVDAGAGLGRDVDEHGLPAPLLRDHVLAGQFLLDTVGVGLGLVDLVDRDHQGHAGGTGVLDRLDGLRLDAVVGGHHQDHDVGDVGAARAHGGEGGVARGVQERDGAARGLDMVGADVLGDAAGFAGRHLGAADVVQQRGLAVIDVAHDGHHRRTGAGFAQGAGLAEQVRLPGRFP